MAERTVLEPEGDPQRRSGAVRTNLEGDRSGSQRRAGPVPTNLEGGELIAMSPGFNPLPPSLIARGYHIIRRLGGGAEASVYLCASGSGEEVAVRVTSRPPKFSLPPEYLDGLDEDWVVQVHDRGADAAYGSQVHYEVMEFCKYGSLEHWLNSRPQPESADTALQILRELVNATKGMQGVKKNVLHGDLKPENVLVRSEVPLDLVIADFGLTADLGERSKLSNTNGIGSAAYNAPERLKNTRSQSDWWSVGMIMFRVLVGRDYFSARGEWFTQSAIDEYMLKYSELPLGDIDSIDLPDVQRARWKHLLAGLLTRNTDHRWGADQVLEWLAGESPAVRRPTDVNAVNAPVQPVPGRARVGFSIANVGDFFDAATLGRAMAEHPAEAVRLLMGVPEKKLLAWLKNEAKTGDSYWELEHNSAWGPDEKLTYLVSRLDPDGPLTYRGFALAVPGDLRNLAGSASKDEPASQVVASLYQADLLGSVTNEIERAQFSMINANWRDLVDHAQREAGSRGIFLTPMAVAYVMREALKLATGDSATAQEYASMTRVRISRNPLAAETAWFSQLQRDAGL